MTGGDATAYALVVVLVLVAAGAVVTVVTRPQGAQMLVARSVDDAAEVNAAEADAPMDPPVDRVFAFQPAPVAAQTPAAAGAEVRMRIGPGCDVTALPDLFQTPWNIVGCESAPFNAAVSHWVVVLESVNAEERSWQNTRSMRDVWVSRFSDARRDDQIAILWTDFYESLNPGLFAIVSGPYRSESAAKQAASAIGFGAYSREVSGDPEARYCLVEVCDGKRD